MHELFRYHLPVCLPSSPSFPVRAAAAHRWTPAPAHHCHPSPRSHQHRSQLARCLLLAVPRLLLTLPWLLALLWCVDGSGSVCGTSHDARSSAQTTMMTTRMTVLRLVPHALAAAQHGALPFRVQAWRPCSPALPALPFAQRAWHGERRASRPVPLAAAAVTCAAFASASVRAPARAACGPAVWPPASPAAWHPWPAGHARVARCGGRVFVCLCVHVFVCV